MLCQIKLRDHLTLNKRLNNKCFFFLSNHLIRAIFLINHEKDYVVSDFKIWFANKLLVNLVQWSLSNFNDALTSGASLTGGGLKKFCCQQENDSCLLCFIYIKDEQQ